MAGLEVKEQTLQALTVSQQDIGITLLERSNWQVYSAICGPLRPLRLDKEIDTSSMTTKEFSAQLRAQSMAFQSAASKTEQLSCAELLLCQPFHDVMS